MAIIRLRLSQMDPSPRGGRLESRRVAVGSDAPSSFLCSPAIFAALFITMAVSFDEFAVSPVRLGLERDPTGQGPPGFLQGQVSPKINVIGTFVFLTTMTLVVLAQILLMKRGTGGKAGQ